MSSIQQVQQVAKKLETMLETALSQLKSEQRKRKENENRLMELELDFVNKEHEVKMVENKFEEVMREKDDKIGNLESSINYLQSVIIEKEQEIARLQELLTEQGENTSIDLSENVEKFENTLNKLLENSSNANSQKNTNFSDDDDMHEEVMTLNEEENHCDSLEDKNDEVEEYILDESMEELQNEDDNIAEITKEDNERIRDIKDMKPKPRNSDLSEKTCPQCGLSFPTKTKLMNHQREADHLPKFECDLCGKYFKSKSIKERHKARIHSDLMPFKCGKCDKRFKDQGSCRRHEANDSVHIRYEYQLI